MLVILRKALRLRMLAAWVLAVAVAALIWFKAPHLGFDEQRPFASASARLWLIAACALGVMLSFALRGLVRALRDLRIVRRSGGNRAAAPADDRVDESPAASTAESPATTPSRRRQQRIAVNDLIAAALRWTRSDPMSRRCCWAASIAVSIWMGWRAGCAKAKCAH